MDCIDLFKRAAVALQTDSRYLVLDQTRKANDKDEELQNLIGEFNLARMDLNNEIGKSERNDARIAELNEKVNSLYGQIMGNEGMVAYSSLLLPAPAAAPPAAAATKTGKNKTRLCKTDRVLFAKAVTSRKLVHRTIERERG